MLRDHLVDSFLKQSLAAYLYPVESCVVASGAEREKLEISLRSFILHMGWPKLYYLPNSKP